MSYTLQAFIAKTGVFPSPIPDGLHQVQLPQDMALIPLDTNQRLKLDIEFCPLTDGGATELTAPLRALASKLSQNGHIAYIEAEIFGGTGIQASQQFSHGKAITTIAIEINAINVALKSLGVSQAHASDEFDAIGLGIHRDTDQWIKGHSQKNT
ncbi:hypothetical protein [Undibacterium luofuense]|uniref:Uncharacterized protein n=1 Tax=Undibacterium luofuense TaxID=2828733 RepID=A0A941DJU8_9BURK|nr:hypothetical protein [Undibacterium luofuense]MBR7782342.1 hypothetical protein [Undibacterium luofuense]